jgi:hypothetical protein
VTPAGSYRELDVTALDHGVGDLITVSKGFDRPVSEMIGLVTRNDHGARATWSNVLLAGYLMSVVLITVSHGFFTSGALGSVSGAFGGVSSRFRQASAGFGTLSGAFGGRSDPLGRAAVGYSRAAGTVGRVGVAFGSRSGESSAVDVFVMRRKSSVWAVH